MNSPNKLPPRRGEFSFKLEKILLVCQTKAFKKKVAKNLHGSTTSRAGKVFCTRWALRAKEEEELLTLLKRAAAASSDGISICILMRTAASVHQKHRVFFSNATRVDEEKKVVRRVANVAASAPGSLCCSDLSRLDSASTEYDLCRRRKKLLIWA